jgi:hypothetical protein
MSIGTTFKNFINKHFNNDPHAHKPTQTRKFISTDHETGKRIHNPWHPDVLDKKVGHTPTSSSGVKLHINPSEIGKHKIKDPNTIHMPDQSKKPESSGPTKHEFRPASEPTRQRDQFRPSGIGRTGGTFKRPK